MTEGMDDSEEFPIVDLVIHFCGGQSFGIVSAGAQFLGHGRVPLPKDCT